MCEFESSPCVEEEEERVTTAWEETARRPSPGRLTGDELFEVIGMAAEAKDPNRATSSCGQQISINDWRFPPAIFAFTTATIISNTAGQDRPGKNRKKSNY